MKKNVEKQIAAAKRDEAIQNLNKRKLIGEVICWNARSEKGHTLKDVQSALTKAGLDQSVARQLLPRFAFTRACKKLSEDRAIDVVRDTSEVIKFQFTKKQMNNEEWEYKKETQLVLNKTTGKVSCQKKELEAVAQKLLDEALEARTTSDISHIIQKLFEKHGELFPIRDQGGVYFVPKEHCGFVENIGIFVRELEGRLTIFPVPAGDEVAKASAKSTVAEAIQSIIRDHEEAIEGFDHNTRSDTMENVADKIKATRQKVEAYADYLQDMSKDLLDSVEQAKKKLLKRIDEVNSDKFNNTEGRKEIMGHAVSKVLKWMGKNEWNFEEAKSVIEHYEVSCKDSTIRGQLWCGKVGQFGPPAELNAKEIKTLEKVRNNHAS